MFKRLITHKIVLPITFLSGFTLLSAIVIFWPKNKIVSPLVAQTLPNVLSETTQANEIVPSPNQSTLGVLLLGFGGAGHEGGFLTDAIQILYADFTKGTLAFILIPRDLWVKTANGKETKINAVTVDLGKPALKKLLSEITGLQIDYVVSVDFVGFQRAIGINLKGIDVDVSETLDDPWYPIPGEELNTCDKTPQEMKEVHAKYSGFELERQFGCRYKHLHFEKGTRHMEGGDALEYVRSRHGSSEGDISRGRRQQEVLTAIRKKLFSLSVLDKLPGFFSEIVKHTQTDINLEIVNYLLLALKKSQDFKVQTVNLSTTNVLTSSNSKQGSEIIIPKAGNFKWDGIREFIQREIKDGK